MGAVLNVRPDLFRAAIVRVPFVDVLTSQLDTTLPSSVTEYDEVRRALLRCLQPGCF